MSIEHDIGNRYCIKRKKIHQYGISSWSCIKAQGLVGQCPKFVFIIHTNTYRILAWMKIRERFKKQFRPNVCSLIMTIHQVLMCGNINASPRSSGLSSDWPLDGWTACPLHADYPMNYGHSMLPRHLLFYCRTIHSHLSRKQSQ